MQMELDGKTFYENGAKKASAPMIRKVFETLAVEEHRHYHFFKNMKKNKTLAEECLEFRKAVINLLIAIGIEKLVIKFNKFLRKLYG